MVKFTTAFFVATTIAGAVPSLAYNTPADIAARSIDIISEDPVLARQFVEAVYGRELTDSELQEREPFFGLLFGAAKMVAKVATKAIHNRHKRSFEDDLELDSRAEFGGDYLEARDIYGRELTDSELQEREPFFGLLFGAAKMVAKVATKAIHNRHKRSFEDDLELDLRAEFGGDLLEERDIYEDAFDELD